MQSIFICEDDSNQLKRLENIINKNVMIEDYDMRILLSTDEPDEIIDFLENTTRVNGIYFLDIDLEKKLNGVQLGSIIRKKDPDAKIIFITTHSELLSLTFQYKVEALDYIIKDQPELIMTKVHECLRLANEYYTVNKEDEPDRIKIKINNQIRIFLIEEILFFETAHTAHKINLHLKNGAIEVYGSLSEISELSEHFIRVHKSFVVNKKNIKAVDSKNKIIVMSNDDTCLISFRGLKLIKDLL
ncbi:LytR/AlgR family response regulator transcription factor [Vagococcus silagei]|uniref:Response regulator transcription factor n=1 Tax=Vagococcus silagei TaxID=2508885 RepID=A0A4S3B464_9ENTE|nr:LytTR family DNA-binding domain-containing protein [Vagococcus silagei]THB60570.1 response regulator transcription factor [Vagococcus silagei]